jgi:hypothetical protein
MKKLIVTPEGTFEVELTAEDIAQRQLDEQEKSKKQSAIAKLKALGLDEEEVKAILGV